VSPRLIDRGIRLVLLDIEGTTTPIAFVHETLFPFARAHLADWCRASSGSPEYREVADRLAVEHSREEGASGTVPAWRSDTPAALDESLRVYALWLMDRDRKSPGLKLLQGFIWEEGYQAGQLRGEVYADVPAALRDWRRQGLEIAIYSSGSELAQRRLFESTEYGDLTPLIAEFFDTSVGPKQTPSSYARIASELGQTPDKLLFVSDVTAELAAAIEAGYRAVLSLRPGNATQRDAERFEAIRTLGELA